MEPMDHDAEPAGETLAFGRDRPRRRWLTVVVVALAGLLVAAAAVDRFSREREVDALIDDVEAVGVAVSTAHQRISAMQQYVRPVSASGQASGRLATDLDSLVSTAAAVGARQVLAQQSLVDENTVLPWHDDVTRAQAGLSDYVEAQADRLSTFGVDGAAPGVVADGTLADAVSALRAAAVEPGQSVRLERALDGLPGVRDLP